MASDRFFPSPLSSLLSRPIGNSRIQIYLGDTDIEHLFAWLCAFFIRQIYFSLKSDPLLFVFTPLLLVNTVP